MKLATHEAKITQEVLTLGREHGWTFFVLGEAPMPLVPVQLGDWLIVPAQQDSTPIPDRTWKRIQALTTGGLALKGFVLVHEAPRLLPASVGSAAAIPANISLNPPARRELMRKITRALPAVLGAIGLAVAGAAVLAMLLALVAAGILVFGAAAVLVGGLAVIDPILIAVTEDEVWIEVDRWWQDTGGGG